MNDVISDNPDIYQSPLSSEMQAAVGRIITCWSSVESALCNQVARIIALHPDAAAQAFEYDHQTYVKASAVCVGISAKAALTQIQNLIQTRAAEIKPHANKILKIKVKRDAIAHSLSGYQSDDIVLLNGFRGSAVNMGTDKAFSITEIDNWCNALKSNSRAIDKIITDSMGWSNERMRIAGEQWLQSRADRA